jgi:DNA polymerase-3 subunit gamma/tau
LSLALARKYRPSSFEDLIGQESVSQTLSLALQNQRLSHAYLFSGLRGSGKTSTARIFAKALLCEKGPTAHPCNECSHCQMANSNSHMDIIEMDAASNRGIDDIKELIEHTKYKPSSARFKIFIIDEVHMLTNQAFNALLKTLEEPPEFVKFILATTDPLKLPATILSRTQHFRFKKIPQKLVQQHLEHILNLENIGYESEAISIIARSGAGSLRDSLTLLDQAIVYSKNFVDLNTVTNMLGIIEPSVLEELLDNILHKNHTKIIEFISIARDYESEMIIDELTLYLKEMLISQNSKFTPMIIERFFRILADSKQLLSIGSDGEFVLSLMLFKMIEATNIQDIDAMIKTLESELKGITSTQPTPQTTQQAPVITITQDEIEQATPKTSNDEKSIKPTEVITITQDEIEQTTPKTSNDEKSIKPTEVITITQDEIEQTTPKISNDKESIKPTEVITITQDEIEASIPKPTEQTTTDTQSIQPKVETPTPPQKDPNQNLFDSLVAKIYDRDYELGSCFERNIEFVSFQDNNLTWNSIAADDDKKMLINHWGIINMFVKEVFGLDTKIINISKKKLDKTPQPQPTPPTHDDADSSSMIEDIEMKSSCIMPQATNNEATKEKDPSTILEEPMIKTAIELLSPKKVRIKRNV